MANKKDTVSTYTNRPDLETEALLAIGAKDVPNLKEVGNSKVLTFIKEVTVEQTPKTLYNSTVKLQSLRDANISYTGQVTKRQYQWNGAGSVQVVDALDAPYLLEKRIQSQSCCGVNDTAIFQQVD